MRHLLIGVALGALAAPAFAACVEGPQNVYVCSGTNQTSRLKDGSDNVSVTVNGGARVEVDDKDAIRLDGDGSMVVNNGVIKTTVPAGTDEDDIKADGVQSDGESLTVTNSGSIEAAAKGVKADDKNGLTVDNTGSIIGGIEGIDGADDFTLTNGGGARVVGLTDDAVSAGDVTIVNYGLIESVTDDGVDADSGLIENYGVIRSNSDSATDEPAGVNVDAEGEDDQPAPTLIVRNSGGGRIEGAVGIEYEQNIPDPDPDKGKTSSTAKQIIENGGLIYGRSGVAVRMGPDQGDSRITLMDAGIFQGDVIFGAGDDLMAFRDIVGTGALGGVFDGMGGTDTADFSSFLKRGDLLGAVIAGGVLKLDFNNINSLAASASFRNFERFRFMDGDYASSSFAVAPAPLPAALPMLALALGGLAALRRR